MTTETKTFEIVYVCPTTGEQKTVTQIFTGNTDISAKEWAEDFAYGLSDKGRYKVKEMK